MAQSLSLENVCSIPGHVVYCLSFSLLPVLEVWPKELAQKHIHATLILGTMG